MKEKLRLIESEIGKTPVVKINLKGINLYAKLEYQNFAGSLKARPAIEIIKAAIDLGRIGKDTIVIESSSGNLAIALAKICRTIGVRFVAVIDSNTSSYYEEILRDPAKDGESWECEECNKVNPESFEICWSCQANRLTVA